ncbi:hypothetical protein FRC08_011446, partial [Ceratobasidium sp. 394]
EKCGSSLGRSRHPAVPLAALRGEGPHQALSLPPSSAISVFLLLAQASRSPEI